MDMSELFNFPSHFKNLINFSFAQKCGIGLRRIKSAAGKHGKFKPNFKGNRKHRKNFLYN